MDLRKSVLNARRKMQKFRRRRGKNLPSSLTIQLMLALLLLYCYTSMIMVALFNHRRNLRTDIDLSSSSHRHQFFTQVSSIEEKCSSHPMWSNVAWKEAIVHPILCGSSAAGDAIRTPSQEQELLLFKETMYNYSHFKQPPCGQYCIYPFQTVYSYSYGLHTLGYALVSSPNNPNFKCWKPFNTQYEHNPCGKENYNWWIKTMEEFVSVATIPAYQCSFWNHSRPDSILSDSSRYISSRHNNCHDVQIVYDYVLKQSVKRYECLLNEEEMNMNMYDKMMLWFKPSSHSAAKSQHSKEKISEFIKRTEEQTQESQKSPFCSKQLLEVSDPSEIAYLYDTNQLGLHSLADAMSIFNYSNFNTNNITIVTKSSCDSESNKCIYHRHSVPLNIDDHHPIKGWEYSNVHQCFIPLADMTAHPTCGRWSNQYMSWSRRMIEKKEVGNSPDGLLALSKTHSNDNCAKCDKLRLSRGRYFWDFNKNVYKASYIPPTNDDGNVYHSVCGPRILFVGAAHCGTNQLPPLLAQHPRIKLNLCPDSSFEKCNIKYFQGDYNNYTNSVASIWDVGGLSHGYISDPINYVSRLAQKLPFIVEGDKQMTFDISSSYINTDTFPNIAQRIHELLPSAKIIVNVCDPVKHMHADYDKFWNHQIYAELFYNDSHIRIPKDFTEYVQDMDLESVNCKKNPDFCFRLRRDRLETGRYIKHIQQWQNYYGKENVLVLDSKDSNEIKMKKIFNLMGECLPDNEYPWKTVFSTKHDEIKNVIEEYDNNDYECREAYEWLYNYFEQSNADLSIS